MIRVSCSLSERQIACELRKIFFPPKGRICCVRCQSFRVKKVPKEDRYHCPKCRKKFSLLSGTWLGHLRIPLTTFMILLWSWMKGYSVDQAHDLTSLSVVTIRSSGSSVLISWKVSHLSHRIQYKWMKRTSVHSKNNLIHIMGYRHITSNPRYVFQVLHALHSELLQCEWSMELKQFPLKISSVRRCQEMWRCTRMDHRYTPSFVRLISTSRRPMTKALQLLHILKDAGRGPRENSSNSTIISLWSMQKNMCEN